MKTISLLLCLIFSTSSWASPEEMLKHPLRGQGEYKWLFLSVYDAKLWGPKTDVLYNGPVFLELKYKRSFAGKDIVKQSEKELKNAGVEESELKKWRSKMLEIFPDVNEGDIILASFYPDKGIVFYLNSKKELGKIPDIDFSKKFLDIWLGKKTSAPQLRDQLLGII